jgi:hypothetical protein
MAMGRSGTFLGLERPMKWDLKRKRQTIPSVSATSLVMKLGHE